MKIKSERIEICLQKERNFDLKYKQSKFIAELYGFSNEKLSKLTTHRKLMTIIVISFRFFLSSLLNSLPV